MQINPNIFREYDIRGVVADDLGSDVVVELGKGIGTLLRRKGATRITIGRDGRLSSERIATDLKAGLLSTGLLITDVGQCPTPTLYFSISHLQVDGGIMVTGSHNPPEFNGIKMTLGKVSIFGEMIQFIRKLIEKQDYEKGTILPVEKYEILEPYIAHLSKNLKLDRSIRLAVDSGNGVGGLVAPQIYKAIGATVYDLFTEVDGRFPNHHPDPTVEKNLVDLKKIVAEKNLEVGLGLDGDADRIGAIDSSGKVIWGDQLLILFARQILKKNPGATIIADVKCSENFFSDVKKHGGKPVMWMTGHALIKSKLWEEKALLAGEMSGHIFFADRYFGYDDGIYAGARLAEIVSQLPHSLSQELSDLPPAFNTPEIRVDCSDESKFKVVEKTKTYFKSKGLETIDIDGVRVKFDGGWALVRASNTQPTLVLRFEATSKNKLDEIEHDVRNVLMKETGFDFTAAGSAGH